jgi:hypothetical protein
MFRINNFPALIEDFSCIISAMPIKDVLGGIATFIAVISYLPYIKDVLANKTKPHAITWLIWSVLTFTSFLIQITNNAGPAAWVNGFTLIVAIIIFVLSLTKGKQKMAWNDWLTLVGAAVAFLFWFITKQPIISVLLIVCIDLCGFIPTICKSYLRPQEETLSAFVMSDLKYCIALFALNEFSIATAVYPIIYSIVMNSFFVTLLVVRRKQLGYKV